MLTSQLQRSLANKNITEPALSVLDKINALQNYILSSKPFTKNIESKVTQHNVLYDTPILQAYNSVYLNAPL